MPITVEVARDVDHAESHAALAAEVAGRLRAEQNFAAAVTLVAEGTIAGEGKTRRVLRSYAAAAER